MTSRHTITRATILAAVLCLVAACGSEGANPAPEVESEIALRLADSSNWMVRLIDILADHQPPFAATPDETAVAQIDRVVALTKTRLLRGCTRVTRAPGSAQATIELTNCRLLTITIDAEIEVEAAADFSGEPDELRVTWIVSSMTIEGRRISGRYHRTFRSEGGVLTASMNIAVDSSADTLPALGAIDIERASLASERSLRFQHDHTIQYSAECTIVDGLAYAESPEGQLTFSYSGVELCGIGNRCPRKGQIAVAGHYLHRIQLTGTPNAIYSIDGEPQPDLTLRCR